MNDIDTYSLYQTLSGESTKKDLTIKQKKELIKNIESFNESHKVAFLRLMIEHYRLTNEVKEWNAIPYGKTISFVCEECKFLAKESSLYESGALKCTNCKKDFLQSHMPSQTLEFDIAELPLDLRWILYKFSNVSL